MLSICPQVRNLEVPVEGTRVVTLSIEGRAETLPTVQVLGGRMSGGRTGFAQRERMGLGHFVGPDRIKRMGGATLMDVLLRTPGLWPEYSCSASGCVRRVSMRGMMTIRSPSGRCYPNLYIDGMRSFEYWDVVDTFFLKDDIVGIEVYQGYGSIPSQFDPHNGCGSVVVCRSKRFERLGQYVGGARNTCFGDPGW